jgi:hypothetical protein
MPMLEGKVDAVIGVDTHRDRHTAAILDPNGGLVAQLEIPATRPAPRPCWALSPSEHLAAAAGRWRHRLLWRRPGQLPGRPG